MIKKRLRAATETKEFISTTKFLWEKVSATSKTSQLKASLLPSRKALNSKRVKRMSHMMKKKRVMMIARINQLIHIKKSFNRRCAKITIQIKTLC